MNVFTRDDSSASTHYIHIIEPKPEDCESSALPPEGNVKFRNYRLLSEYIRAYTPTGDITSPSKNKLTARYNIRSAIPPPHAKILELLRPEDPGRDALEAIVRPAPRRGLTRPLDDDTRRFLQRALQSPGPVQSKTNTSESQHGPESIETVKSSEVSQASEKTSHKLKSSSEERSLAEELEEAEEGERSGAIRREWLREWRKRGVRDAVERERLGRLALSVEEDEVEDNALTATARRLDALLAESRVLHDELAEIHEDLQAQSARARRCTVAARTLSAETRALRYLDDVVALLRGDVTSATTVQKWPFALSPKQPGRNYII